MKIELRKFKSYPRLSEETTAFNAEVWVDGVKAGEASNRGHGDPNLVHFADKDLYQRFLAHVKGLPPDQSEYGSMPMGEDLFIGLLVDHMENKAWLERKGKKAVVFTMPGAPKGQYSLLTLKSPGDRAGAVAQVKRQYPKATIVAGGV